MEIFSGILSANFNCKYFSIYVVVNFLSQVVLVFLLFLGMVMYANDV